MKKAFLTLLLLNSICIANAQDVKIKWGQMFKTQYNQSPVWLLYNDAAANKMYSYSIYYKDGKTLYLGELDENLVFHKSQEYAIASDDDSIKYRGMYYFNNYFMLLTSKYNKDLANTTFYYQKIDKDFHKVGSTTEIFNFNGDSRYIEFELFYSDDSSKICFFAYLESTKKENSKITFKVYDENFKTVLDKKTQIENSVYYNTDVFGKMVSNNGNVYLLYKEFTNEDGDDAVKSASGKKDAPGFKTQLLKYTDAANPKIIPIDQEGKFFDRCSLKSDHAGNPIAIVNYSEAPKVKSYGIKFFKFDNKTDSIILKSSYEIPKSKTARIEKIGQSVNQDEAGTFRRTDRDPPYSKFHYTVTDFKIYDDLSMAIVYENNMSYVTADQHGMAVTVSRSASIIVAKLSKEANVEWLSFVPKIQAENGGTYYIGHYTMFFKDKIFLFYNDNPRNNDYDIVNATKRPKSFVSHLGKRLILKMVEIDNKGNLKQSILHDSNSNSMVIPMAFEKLNNSKMLVYSSDGLKYYAGTPDNKLNFGTIDFE